MGSLRPLQLLFRCFGPSQADRNGPLQDTSIFIDRGQSQFSRREKKGQTPWISLFLLNRYLRMIVSFFQFTSSVSG